jgi:DNA processing protein
MLAHGLDRIYPTQNKSLANLMVEHGGLPTKFLCNTNPGKQNFPKSNIIVTVICNAKVAINTIIFKRQIGQTKLFAV